MKFTNIYQDAKRAEAYAKLEFPGTYYLAYRDLPEIIANHVQGKKALDFGCGAGRSTRFLQKLGFEAIGLDISAGMIDQAKKNDPKGDYRLIKDGDFESFEKNHFDLITAIFTFDNIPDPENRLKLLKGLAGLINENGRIILLDSTPEIYFHEWASFSTKGFPENEKAKSGEQVKIVMTDVDDNRPVEDIIWFHEDYSALFSQAGLEVEAYFKPLGNKEEPFNWVNEEKIAPWIIYVLK